MIASLDVSIELHAVRTRFVTSLPTFVGKSVTHTICPSTRIRTVCWLGLGSM